MTDILIDILNCIKSADKLVSGKNFLTLIYKFNGYILLMSLFEKR